MNADLFGLKATTIEQIRQVFSRFPQVERAVLYGSRAKGTFKPGSDIDLTLVGKHLNPQLLGQIADALDDLLLPYMIDLSIEAELHHEALQAHIHRVGKIFYQRNEHPPADDH
jgi:uncharacterized protein